MKFIFILKILITIYSSIIQFSKLKNNLNNRIKNLKSNINNNKHAYNLYNIKAPTISNSTNDNNTFMNNNNLSDVYDYISQDIKNKINEDLNINIFNKI